MIGDFIIKISFNYNKHSEHNIGSLLINLEFNLDQFRYKIPFCSQHEKVQINEVFQKSTICIR